MSKENVKNVSFSPSESVPYVSAIDIPEGVSIVTLPLILFGNLFALIDFMGNEVNPIIHLVSSTQDRPKLLVPWYLFENLEKSLSKKDPNVIVPATPLLTGLSAIDLCEALVVDSIDAVARVLPLLTEDNTTVSNLGVMQMALKQTPSVSFSAKINASTIRLFGISNPDEAILGEFSFIGKLLRLFLDNHSGC